MSRRIRLPGADELFRPTKDVYDDAVTGPDSATGGGDSVVDGVDIVDEGAAAKAGVSGSAGAESVPAAGAPVVKTRKTRSRGGESQQVAFTGRVSHDEKITVYLSSDELLTIDHVTLQLRRETGTKIDRGRLIRAAIAAAIEGWNLSGVDSDLARRLTQS